MNAPVLAIGNAEIADREEFLRDVLAGLASAPRSIPAKYLYDARGSALFDAICDLPEYYLTRTETAILSDCAKDIAELAGNRCSLVEFGSGSSVKSRLLLDAMPELSSYVPIDISRHHLDLTSNRLRQDYPWLRVEPVCADYMAMDSLPELINGSRRIGFFPGSTMGNLMPNDAIAFLRRARRLLRDDGALILGLDLKKDHKRLNDAYNDSAGVTAAFTLNLLRRINRELDGTFDLGNFAHEAFYNSIEGRIEIYFRSLRPQTVSVAGRTFSFARGERVHTEYSYKFDDEGIAKMAAAACFSIGREWLDPDRLFAVVWLNASP